MNYHDNEDELLRMQSRRRRAGSSGNVPSRSRASSHDGRSFRERESFDSIDDAYFEQMEILTGPKMTGEERHFLDFLIDEYGASIKNPVHSSQLKIR